MSAKPQLPVVQVADRGFAHYEVEVIRYVMKGVPERPVQTETIILDGFGSRAEAQETANSLWSAFLDAFKAGQDQ